MTYYNTTHEHGETLRENRSRTEQQEQQVLEFFEFYPDEMFTRCELHKHVLQDAPVSSIVRAIANLTDRELLEKTKIKRMGDMGREVYCWRLMPEEIE